MMPPSCFDRNSIPFGYDSSCGLMSRVRKGTFVKFIQFQWHPTFILLF